jgi:ubiquilin
MSDGGEKESGPAPAPAPAPLEPAAGTAAEEPSAAAATDGAAAVEMVALTVKSTAGTSFSAEVPADSTVLQVKEAVAEQSKIPAPNQRLVFKGQVLKDEKTLVGDYGFTSGSAVHIVRGVAPSSSPPAPAPAPAAATPAAWLGGFGGLGGLGLGGLGGMPPMGGAGMDFNAMQRQMQEQMAANPGMMEQMLNSPAMQSLLSNPDAVQGMIQSNPQMRALMEQHPELRSALSDPNLIRQSLEAARNPALRAEMTRNTDRAMANIEGMPGGYNALAHMYQTGE